MTIVTHVAFSTVIAAGAQAGYTSSIACAVGAALPDLDHPRSAIGRLFFFVSIPLHAWIGHRGISHSFLVWLVPLGIGILLNTPLIQWVAIGALSHILLDCYTVSGVQALLPLTARTVVIFKKAWRIRTGSLQEIIVCSLLLVMLGGTRYAATLGGPRKLINQLMKSPQITAEEFTRAGNVLSYARGRFRWADGRIEKDVRWLVIGTEGKHLVYWNGERLVRRTQGHFLRSTLISTQQEWPMVKLQGIATVLQDSVYFAGQRWSLAREGKHAYGTIKALSGDYPVIKITNDLLPPGETSSGGP
jgi:inner membrane protein